jgi:hypothetical protein
MESLEEALAKADMAAHGFNDQHGSYHCYDGGYDWDYRVPEQAEDARNKCVAIARETPWYTAKYVAAAACRSDQGRQDTVCSDKDWKPFLDEVQAAFPLLATQLQSADVIIKKKAHEDLQGLYRSCLEPPLYNEAARILGYSPQRVWWDKNIAPNADVIGCLAGLLGSGAIVSYLFYLFCEAVANPCWRGEHH